GGGGGEDVAVGGKRPFAWDEHEVAGRELARGGERAADHMDERYEADQGEGGEHDPVDDGERALPLRATAAGHAPGEGFRIPAARHVRPVAPARGVSSREDDAAGG